MEALIPDTLNGFSKPSETEKMYYFCGLAASPHLVARTSTAPFRYSDSSTEAKALSTVGNHPLVERWCPDLRANLIRALNDGGELDWDVFYPVRIGERDALDTREHPVVLLVGLRSDSLCSWETAMWAALRCRACLRAYHVWDVDVELMKGHFVPRASPAAEKLASLVDWEYSQVPAFSGNRDMDMARINSKVMTLLPFCGYRIEQEEAQPGESEAEAGTMGLHIRLTGQADTSGPSETAYGLTNRHVVVGARVAADEDFRQSDCEDKNKPLQVFTGGLSCYRDVFHRLHDSIGYLRRSLQATQRDLFKNTDSTFLQELSKMKGTCLDYAEDLGQEVEKLEDTSTSSRFVGTVAYSPGHVLGHNGNFKDWALVQLSQADSGIETNQVYMAEDVTETAMRHVENTVASGVRQFLWQEVDMDTNGFLRLHGRDIPPVPPFLSDSHTSHLVAKRGQKTGLRFGVTNEIEAVRRHPFKDTDGPCASFHLLVLDFAGGNFSRPGDSGSCVFDCTGRVVGLIDGGQPANSVGRLMKKYRPGDGTVLPEASAVTNQEALPEGFTALTASDVLGMAELPENRWPSDVTFVTPIQWILEEIREFTGLEPEIM